MDKKKIAAAMAAVTAFIKTEEAAAGQMSAAQMVPPAGDPTGPPLRMNLWGITGRQELMQVNTMMQLRLFK